MEISKYRFGDNNNDCDYNTVSNSFVCKKIDSASFVIKYIQIKNNVKGPISHFDFYIVGYCGTFLKQIYSKT